MPVDPSMAEGLARQMVSMFDEAETRMLKEVTRQLRRDIGASDWALRKQLQVSEVRLALARMAESLADATPAQAEAIIAQAFDRGAAAASSELAALGLDATVPATTSQVAALAGELTGSLQPTALRMTRVVEDVYRRAVLEGSVGLITGVDTRRQGAQRVLDGLANRGITGFVDARGRRWDAASYAEMATRTVSGRSAVSGHQSKLQANGFDLVYVSDAPEECPICRPWEGRVLSISGTSPEHASMAEATGAGLFHANCRHSTSLYIPGRTSTPKQTADPERNEQRVQQRYLERGIRQWKRRAAVAMTDSDRRYAEAKVRQWQSRLRQHVDEHDRKRLRYREQIGRAR